MHKDAFDAGIERVEKLFGQEQNVYDKAVLSEIYDIVRHLDKERWEEVVGAVIRTWPYKTLPNISAFEKAKNVLGQTGQRTRKIKQNCPTCSGGGLRAFIYRRDDKFLEGMCLCDCPNAQNFTAPPHMTMERARRLPGFKAASRLGEVPHLLEALNPAPPPRTPSLGDKARQLKTSQEARDKTPTKKTSQRSGKSTEPDTGQRRKPGDQPTSRPGSLVDAAAQLGKELDASQNPRKHSQTAAEKAKATKLVNDLNEWMNEDNEPPAAT